MQPKCIVFFDIMDYPLPESFNYFFFGVHMSGIPEVGQTVVVRGRPYVVEEICRQGLAQEGFHAQTASLTQGGQSLLTLSSLEDDSLGDELRVVWEMEAGAEVRESSSLPAMDGFDPPDHLEAFLHAVRWGGIAQADQRSLQAPFRSAIEPEDYQLEPVARALLMPRVNLLLADDVGLGKTIEAGLVMQELILRHRVRTALIVCPAGLQVQWKEEMRDKFGLEFRIVNKETLGQLRRKRGIHTNPWTHFPRLITSIDYLKRPRVFHRLRETLPAEGEKTWPRRFDLLIVDEAHNIAPSASLHYAVESQRTRLIRQLAPHFEHRLFLTATPHNGYRESFSALLELLDDQRFIRGVLPSSESLARAMVRRMKEEIVNFDGTPRFPRRVVRHIPVPHTDEERQAHALLQRYTGLCLTSARAQDNPAMRQVLRFVLKLLKKRLFSSPAAFRDTLECHKQSRLTAAHSLMPTAVQLTFHDMDEDEDELSLEDVQEVHALAGAALGNPAEEEQSILHQLTAWAESAAQRSDSKSRALLDWLKEHIRPKGAGANGWNDQRVIIFTEYTATLHWLTDQLAAAGFTQETAQGKRLMHLYGGMPQDEREAIKAAFQAGPESSAVRILLATDAASEGINLQNHCSRLIHYEIPWNPSRLEQRNGRVDRHGQRAAEVDIFHFVSAGFEKTQGALLPKADQLAGDLEFLMRAVHKVENIRQDLGKVGPVIAEQVEKAMLRTENAATPALNTSQAEREAASVRSMLKLDRDLRKLLSDLGQQLDETRRNLLLTPANLHHTVEVALQLAKQPSLMPTAVEGLPPGSAFHLPQFLGAWRHCLEGLEHPHTGVIRPLVFDASLAVGRDDVVAAHLNHRLVSMSLRLLRAQIWSAEADRRLYRCCTRLVPPALLSEPVLLAHGRIVVLGETNHRIFEELVMAGGRVREGRFARLGVRELEGIWQAAMQGVPAPATGLEVRLMKLWPNLRAPLLDALENRKQERLKTLHSRLDEMAGAEVRRFEAVMDELQQAIEKELKAASTPQQLSLFSEAEEAQYQADRAVLRQRLRQLPEERGAEVEHLRRRYSSPRANLFPVAAMWLVPEHLAR